MEGRILSFQLVLVNDVKHLFMYSFIIYITYFGEVAVYFIPLFKLGCLILFYNIANIPYIPATGSS